MIHKFYIKYAYKTFKYNNPAQDITLLKIEKKEAATLSKSAVNALVKRAVINKSGTDIGILLGLYTGMRLGEICALKWSDIDFKERTVNINKTMIRVKTQDIASKTKTEIIITPPKFAKS